MLEYVFVFLIVGLAACFVISRYVLRRDAGCACGCGFDCASAGCVTPACRQNGCGERPPA